MNDEYVRFIKPLQTAAVALLVIGSVFLAAKTVSAIQGWVSLGGDKTKVAEITASGKGEVFAVPDVATFTFTVTEEGNTVKEAQDKATRKMNAALDYLKKAEIADKDIKTVAYNANPKYEYQQPNCTALRCPPGKQVLVGYEVSQTIQIKVRDTGKAGTILSGIGGLNVQYVSGLQFTIDDEDKLIEQAREKAVMDAKAKAQVLAEDLGVRLVRITSFSEGNQGGVPPMYFGEMKAANGRGDAAVAPSIPTGENKYTSNVTITYEIR